MSTFKTRQISRRRFGRAKRRMGVGKVSKLQRQVNTLRRKQRQHSPEVKYKDTSEDDLDVYSTAGVNELTLIQHGTTDITRIGDKIHLQSVQLKYFIEQKVDAANSLLARIVLVTETEPQGTAPVWTNVYDTESVISLRKMINAKRWTVLYDRLHRLSRDETTALDDIKFAKVFKKIQLKIEYDGNAAPAQMNGIYIMFLANTASGNVDLTYRARIRYTDN